MRDHRTHSLARRRITGKGAISRLLMAGSIFALFVHTGCGSGTGRPPGNLTGTVSDVDGRVVAGANVAVGSNSTNSLTNGTFTLDNVSDGIRTVIASIDINGHRWSGQTDVDIAAGEQNRSQNLVVSDERFHGTIKGTVFDQDGFTIEGAKVFIGGPYGSTLAVTNKNGDYTAPRITPGLTYTVTCSLAGFQNDTKSLHVTANQTTTANFSLTTANSQGTIPAPTNVTAQAWTVSDTISRADTQTKGVFEWLKHIYRQKRGLKEGPQAKKIERLVAQNNLAGRATPLGSVVEVDLFWSYPNNNGQPYNDFFGYAIKRGTNQNNLNVTAILRDPLASLFFDADPLLSPDVTYYYTVHSLETIDFPRVGTLGPASNVASAAPLGPMVAQSPAQGAVVSATPTLQWSRVNGAAGYQIYVWSQFPGLQFDPSNPNEPNAVAPVWPQDLNNPGSSFLSGNNSTSATYQGPALVSGHTYYWLVVAVDSTNPQNVNALSATPLRKFTVQ